MKSRPWQIINEISSSIILLLLIITLLLPSSRPDCIVGPDVLGLPLSNVGSYLQIFTSIRFPCSGKIVRWNYYSRAMGTPVYFGVWEAVNSTTFRLVDYNRIIPNATGLLHEEILDPAEYVSVTPGLYLGIHYDSIDIPQDRQVVPYADAVNPDPYTLLALSDGFPVGVGHNQIVQLNGYITFTGILFKNWRLPALQASVKFLIDCGKPPVIPASKITYKTTLAFSNAVYQCNSGYRLVGSPIATCQSSGLWSAPPICDINDLCFAGPDLYDAPLESASSLLQLFPSLTFTCGGFVGRWWFYSRVNSRIVYLSVWRQVAGTNAVKLIGANRILAANRGLNYFRVPDDDMIFVDPGDFIGIFYDRPDLPITDVVIPFAAEHNLAPYMTNDLTETLLLPMGRLDISSTNGYIDLTKHADGAIAYWRVPAVRSYVIIRQPSNPPIDKSGVPVCPQPPLVAYATIAFSSTKVGSLAVYSCVQGYTLYGENPIKCLTTQKWSGAPECRLIPRCTDPPVIDNAVPYFNSTSVGSFVTYFCKAGYVVNGLNPIQCLTNLTWGQPFPTCQLASACPPPPVLLNGHLTMTGTLQPRGAVAFFSCKPGYVMVGPSSVFCTDDSTWSTAPVCAPALPSAPSQPVFNKELPNSGPNIDNWERITRPPTTPEWTLKTRWPPVYPTSWGDWPVDYYTTNKPPCNTGCRQRTTTTEEDPTTNFVSFNIPTDVPIDEVQDQQVTEATPPWSDGDQATPATDGAAASPSWPDISIDPVECLEATTLPLSGSETDGNNKFGEDSYLPVTTGPDGHETTGLPVWQFETTTELQSQGLDRTTTVSLGQALGIAALTTTDYGMTATDEEVVLVRTVFSESDDYAPNLLPAVILPIIGIVLIVMFAILFAWFRYKKQHKETAEAIDYSGQPYYENVKNAIPGTAPPASVATGYARGSHSSAGGGYNNEQYGAAPGSGTSKTDDAMTADDDDFVPAAVADMNNAKRAPNFFMTAGDSRLGPMPQMHHSAGSVIPPPPPPLPPPPAYPNNIASVAAISYNNTYYARGRSSDLPTGASRASTLNRRNR